MSLDQLPPRPNLDHLRKSAKRLLAAVRAGDASARSRVSRFACEVEFDDMQLSHCQWALAREHGFVSWRALSGFVEANRSIGGHLLLALRRGDAAEVNAVLDAKPELANACVDKEVHALPVSQRGMRLLHVCVADGLLEMARILLERGADPNVRSSENRTPLHASLELGRAALSELLVAHDADVDVCAAAILGDVERLTSILSANPDLARDRSTGLSPLGWASYGGHPSSARVLAEHGVAIDAFDGLAPACECNHSEFVAVALQLGASPSEHFGRLERTALHHAAELRQTDDATPSARLLLDAGADARAPDIKGVTPIDLARRGAALAQSAKRYDRMLELLHERSEPVA